MKHSSVPFLRFVKVLHARHVCLAACGWDLGGIDEFITQLLVLINVKRPSNRAYNGTKTRQDVMIVLELAEYKSENMRMWGTGACRSNTREVRS